MAVIYGDRALIKRFTTAMSIGARKRSVGFRARIWQYEEQLQHSGGKLVMSSVSQCESNLEIREAVLAQFQTSQKR